MQNDQLSQICNICQYTTLLTHKLLTLIVCVRVFFHFHSFTVIIKKYNKHSYYFYWLDTIGVCTGADCVADFRTIDENGLHIGFVWKITRNNRRKENLS